MEKIRTFFNRFLNNWKMKLVSFILALFLWNSVIINTDPVVSRTTDPLPITLTGEQQLEAKGLAIADESFNYLQQVKVTVLMNRSQSKLFDPADISIYLDLNQITTTGEQTIRVTAYSNEGTIERISPETFTVTVDNRKSKIVSIDQQIIGELPDGYFAGEAIVEPTSVQVTGPSSIVDTVAKGVFTVDITDRKTSIILPKEIILVDKDGNTISSDTLTTNVDSAMFELSILPRKEIQVLGANCVSGTDKLPEGYQIDEIEVYPSTVEVTGSAELLEGLTSLPSEVFDVAGRYEDVSTTIKLVVPPGITMLSTDTVSLIVRISEIMEKAIFEDKVVELRNIPKDMTVSDFEEIRNVEMLVPYNTISTLTASHVKLYLDLADLSEGEHELKIQCEVPEEYRVTDIVIENDMTTVTLVLDN